MVRALHQTANGELSQDRLNVLVSAAMMRSKSLPLGSKYDDTTNFDSKQSQVDTAALSLSQWQNKTQISDGNLWTRFLGAIGQGKPPQQAHDEAVQQTLLENRPSLMGIPPNGKTMIDKEGNMAIMYPDGHFEEINAGTKPKAK